MIELTPVFIMKLNFLTLEWKEVAKVPISPQISLRPTYNFPPNFLRPTYKKSSLNLLGWIAQCDALN